MSDSLIAAQQHEKYISESVLMSMSFDELLEVGESFTGQTPTVTEETTSDLTISNITVSTGTLAIDGQGDVTVGRVIQWLVAGGTVANSPYTLIVTSATDATPAQTRIRKAVLHVRAD